jgi:hypothetical protein
MMLSPSALCSAANSGPAGNRCIDTCTVGAMCLLTIVHGACNHSSLQLLTAAGHQNKHCDAVIIADQAITVAYVLLLQRGLLVCCVSATCTA